MADSPSNLPSVPSKSGAWQDIFLRTALWLSVAVLFGVAVCEQLQPDACAAVTAIPPWCWLIACCLLGGLGFLRVGRRAKLLITAIGLTFTVMFMEQSHSLARSVSDAVFGSVDAGKRTQLRVVTLNCNIGAVAAAREAAVQAPDIVFLQESPTQEAVDELAQSLWGNEGSFVWSHDCSILARGKLLANPTAPATCTQATLQLANGETVELISLRLSPPLVRYDLWNSGCWTEHAHSRRQHRQEAIAIANSLAAIPAGRAVILGGDCNAPAGDGALQVWSPAVRDAFASAGRGWGNTVLNRAPVLRFDQLWCSEGILALSVWSAPTQNSDHRMVVGDFALQAAQP